MNITIKKNILILISIFIIPFSSYAQDSLSTFCRRNIDSFVAVSNQLKNNPNLKKEDLEMLADKSSLNTKLKDFLKSQLIPRLLDKNPDVIKSYVNSKDSLTQCMMSVEKN